MAGELRAWVEGVDGATAPALVGRAWDDLGGERGWTQDANGYSPTLDRASVMALLQGGRALAREHGVPFPGWPELWYATLGYEREGDRFKVSSSWQSSLAPVELVAATFHALDDVAADVEARHADRIAELRFDSRAAAFKHGAQVAWDQLQAERRGTLPPGKVKLPGIPLPDGTTTPPVEVELPATPLPELPRPNLGGLAFLAVFVALAYFGSKNRS